MPARPVGGRVGVVHHDMANALFRFAAHLLVERPARRAGEEALVAALTEGRSLVRDRFEVAEPTSGRKQLAHVIGIERWGGRRLRVALGDAPFERDTLRRYLPAADEDLLAAFDEARTETLALARRLIDEGRIERRVEHNAFGPLSARGWLRYLHMHAMSEIKRAKPVSGRVSGATTR